MTNERTPANTRHDQDSHWFDGAHIHGTCRCGHDCSTHPDAAYGLACCGDCGADTCQDCRVEDAATRCVECAAAFYTGDHTTTPPATTGSRIGKRVRVLTGYAAHARFNAECAADFIGEIPREAQIPSPYAYSPVHVVSDWQGTPVIIVETKHRRYEVFPVTGQIDPIQN